jgi:hypothetical protein
MSFASKSRETSYCDDYPPPVLVPIAPCTPTVSTSTTTCSTTEDAENHISSNIDFAPYIMDLLLEDLVFEESIDVSTNIAIFSWFVIYEFCVVCNSLCGCFGLVRCQSMNFMT